MLKVALCISSAEGMLMLEVVAIMSGSTINETISATLRLAERLFKPGCAVSLEEGKERHLPDWAD
jgi:hypothetical protein